MSALALSQTTLINDANLLSYWAMDGNSTDYKGVNNGSDTGMSYTTNDGKFSQGGHFSGIAYITLTPPSSGGTNVTLMAWINFVTAVSRGTVIFGQLTTGNAIWELSQNGTTGKIQALMRDPAGHISQPVGTNALNDGLWHFVAVTKTSGGTVQLYVDGSPDGATGSGVTGDVFLSNNQSFIGANLNHGQNWNGSIDDIAVFNRALSSTEISNHYNGLDGLTPPTGRSTAVNRLFATNRQFASGRGTASGRIST